MRSLAALLFLPVGLAACGGSASSTTTSRASAAQAERGCPMDAPVRMVSRASAPAGTGLARVVVWHAADELENVSPSRHQEPARVIDEATARALGASPVPGAVWAFASAGAAPCAMQPGRFLLDHEPGRDGGYYRISQELTGACLDDSNHDVPAFITAQAPTLCRYTTASWATGDGKQGDTPPQQLRGWLTKRGCDILCNVIWTTHDAAFGEGGAVRGVQARLYEQRGVVPGAMHLLEMRAHAEAPWTPLTGAETFDGIFTDDRGLRGLTSGRGSSVLQIIPIGPESPQRVNLRPAPDQE